MPATYLPKDKFGMWTPIALFQQPGVAGYKLLCVCDCGTVKDVHRDTLYSGRSSSCGCRRQSHFIHGGARSPEYNIWSTMKARCSNLKNSVYALYGGRGITVCEQWFDYRNFIADMGARPSSRHSIERKDNNLGYSKENCIWATKKEQANNRRPRRWRRKPAQ